MAVERRLFVRFVMSGAVIVQIDPEKSASIDCELIDLSFDGVGLYSAKQLNADAKVKFLIINRQLNVNLGGTGRVVYCQRAHDNKDIYRVGLEFVEVDREQVKSILVQARGISFVTRSTTDLTGR
ncbi:MAG: PilZ domain-containing protein [Candidatus Omnitrophota bacterium]